MIVCQVLYTHYHRLYCMPSHPFSRSFIVYRIPHLDAEGRLYLIFTVIVYGKTILYGKVISVGQCIDGDGGKL